MSFPARVKIDYTNWKGERAKRLILPQRIAFEANELHPEPQWLLHAIDLQTEEARTFAMNNIHSWKTDHFKGD